MEKVEDLDEAKAMIEKLTSEKRKKEELYQNLKKYKKRLKSENKKKEELCESLKKSQNEQLVKIQEAVSNIAKHAQELIQDVDPDTANDHLIECNEADDEKIQYRERKFNLFQEEIIGLKGLLSFPDENKENDEHSDGDCTMITLEKKNKKIKEQLQFKNEQIKNLENTNEKLEEERGKESSSLFDMIATLQAHVDLHEEIDSNVTNTTSKEMEDQENQEHTKQSVAKLKLKLKAVENKYRDCSKTLKAKEDEWRFELETKDQAIAELMTELEKSCALMTELQQKVKALSDIKSDLEDKNTIIEEMMLELEGSHYVMTELKLHNEELSSQLQMLKRKSNERASELKNKDEFIEELMRELEGCRCLVMRLKLQNEEAKWSSQWDKMMREFRDYKPEIADKDKSREELLKEVEDCDHQIMDLMLQNEGTSLMVMILKSAISEKAEMYRAMLTELSCAYEDKECEVHEIEFELQIWKSFADGLRVKLEENYELRKELEASLLGEMFNHNSEK